MNRFLVVLIFSILVLCRYFFPNLSLAAEGPLPTVVINQIRGDESCCRPGNMEMPGVLNSNKDIAHLPIAWALRYDVLKNDQLAGDFTVLPPGQARGILLEVTPVLAWDSGVVYKGISGGADWSEARNAFLVGYSQTERRKLIDTVFAEYYRRFGAFPEFSVSWMVDSWSLNYLRQKYGVRVHELTREQYETDGYTLYGGMFNQPYFPSKTHPLLPTSRDQGMDMLILRQTVSDIEKNYGSAKSFFTSQPNDYLSNSQSVDFSYFVSLIKSMISQKGDGAAAVLGLENSQEWQNFQTEYFRQLLYLVKENQAGRVKIMTPTELFNEFKNNSFMARFLQTDTFPQSGSFWYFGRDYRTRIEIWQGKPVLTDFRIFSPNLSDPYAGNPADKSQAYWILPYLLDSSQQFATIAGEHSNYTGDPVRVDTGVVRFGIELGQKPPVDLVIGNKTVVLKSSEGEIRFNPDQLEIKGSQPRFTSPLDLDVAAISSQHTDQYFTFTRHPRFVLSPKDQKIVMGWENKQLDLVPMATLIKSENDWILKPNTDLVQGQIDSLAHIFQPDRTTFPYDVKQSTFFWHNTQAITGRNAVRLFIDPRNILGRPVALKSVGYQLSDPNGVEASIPNNPGSHMGQFFIDFTANKSAETEVRLTIDGSIAGETAVIRFYSDCSKDPAACLKNPDEVKGFLHVLLSEKRQEYAQLLLRYLRHIQMRTKDLLHKYTGL